MAHCLVAKSSSSRSSGIRNRFGSRLLQWLEG